MSNYKKYNATNDKSMTPQQAINNAQQLSHLYELKEYINNNITCFNYFSSGIDRGVENRPVVDNVLRPNPEACHIRYLPPYTY